MCLKNSEIIPERIMYYVQVIIWVQVQDGMLKITKIELELTPDPNMYILFEKGTRGGISYISNRYSKAKNKYLKFYDPKQKRKHIHLDMNILYTYAMPKLLPTGGSKWTNPKEFNMNKYTSNSSKRGVLKVDLEYSKQIA